MTGGEKVMKVRSITLKQVALALLLAAAMCIMAAAEGEQKYDDSTPLEELKTAAVNGESEAMLEYGMRLMEGKGVAKDTAEGLGWFQKAADAGNAQGWYAMGFVYSNGVGVELDIAKSVNYYRKGAEAGDSDCQTSMGMLYQAGDRIPSGIDTDIGEAARWYRMAADQNHTEAIQHLAMINISGKGIEKNEEEAAKLFRKGAELGNADCLWGLGQCYLEGRGVSMDTVMAYALYSASLAGVAHPEQKKAMTARRDKLGETLTSDQLKRAEPIVKEWEGKLQD